MSQPPSPEGPLREYTRRLEARQAQAAEWARRERRLSDLRLLLFGLFVVALVLALGLRWFPMAWALLPLGGFVALVLMHDRAIRSREAAERAVLFYQAGLDRLQDRWEGQGNTGERFRDPEHLYADDLDLFGRGSLFELLCTAQTRTGEETLARWLKEPASPEEVRARQEAVSDLRPRLDLREEAALLGQDVRHSVEVDEVIRWGEAPVHRVAGWVSPVAFVLAAVTVAAGIWWISGNSALPFVLAFAVGQLFAWRAVPRAGEILHHVDAPARQLLQLGRLLARLEHEEWKAPRLRAFREGLLTAGELPSRRLGRLDTLVSLQQVAHNGVFVLIGLLLLWPMQVAIRLERWREESGKDLRRWLTLTGEWEALSALAGYAYEHPEHTFPEVLEGGCRWEGTSVAHPLIHGSVAVPNDVSLGPDTRVLLVSGSNMSGKSTLMRTVGVNTVLALAGAPVRARKLALSPVVLGASIRTQDSLQGGISRFYAEILRLRHVVDRAGGEWPLLFLLDEILHGTNSHDRRIGAEAVIRTLVARGGVGLVTTHDLALARISEDPELRARNVHFQDDLVDGKMHFDYHLRPGVVERSNALELMRAVGLDV